MEQRRDLLTDEHHVHMMYTIADKEWNTPLPRVQSCLLS